MAYGRIDDLIKKKSSSKIKFDSPFLKGAFIERNETDLQVEHRLWIPSVVGRTNLVTEIQGESLQRNLDFEGEDGKTTTYHGIIIPEKFVEAAISAFPVYNTRGSRDTKSQITKAKIEAKKEKEVNELVVKFEEAQPEAAGIIKKYGLLAKQDWHSHYMDTLILPQSFVEKVHAAMISFFGEKAVEVKQYAGRQPETCFHGLHAENDEAISVLNKMLSEKKVVMFVTSLEAKSYPELASENMAVIAIKKAIESNATLKGMLGKARFGVGLGAVLFDSIADANNCLKEFQRIPGLEKTHVFKPFGHGACIGFVETNYALAMNSLLDPLIGVDRKQEPKTSLGR